MTVWPQPGTDCHRLLEVLADGQSHSYRTLYRLGLMVHSRAADLRARGYDIQVEACRNEYGERDYTYQLVSGPLPSPGQGTAAAATAEPVPGDENGHQLELAVESG